MPKTVARHVDNVPFFDELMLKLGNPFELLTFTTSEHDGPVTSPTSAPALIVDARPFHDDEDYQLNSTASWPLADTDQPLPPLASAALSALASLDELDEMKDDA